MYSTELVIFPKEALKFQTQRERETERSKINLTSPEISSLDNINAHEADLSYQCL